MTDHVAYEDKIRYPSGKYVIPCPGSSHTDKDGTFHIVCWCGIRGTSINGCNDALADMWAKHITQLALTA
jgi:hypothetical protein